MLQNNALSGGRVSSEIDSSSLTLAQSEIGIYSADVPEKNSRVKYDPSVVMSYALHPLRLRPPT